MERKKTADQTPNNDKKQALDTAIRQIKQKNYPAKLAEYTGDILLVGINYDKETKQHTCQIEQTYHNRTEQ